MTGFALRPATADDAASVAQIWREGWSDGHRGHVPDALVAVRTPESFDSDTAVASSTARSPDSRWSSATSWNSSMFPGRIGAGSRRPLLADGRRAMGAAGHPRAWLAVATGNTRARRFDEKSGWVDEDRLSTQRRVNPATSRCRRIALPLRLGLNRARTWSGPRAVVFLVGQDRGARGPGDCGEFASARR